MTSDPVGKARSARLTALFVFGSWALMLLLGLFWIARYTVNSPLIDEWEFVPALLNDEPTLPWLWTQHNEHRFPLPRMIYYPLFQLTHDFRTGCYVSLCGMALLSLGMIRLARNLRGRLHWSDAFFPLSLIHLGHVENFRMGYQICFMLITVLAGWILSVILRTSWNNLWVSGLKVGLLLIPLLGCGAGGLAFGPPLALWLLIIVFWLVAGYSKSASAEDTSRFGAARIGLLLVLIASVPVFIALYYQGYAHPEHHPKSAGVLPSLRIAVQALTMAFGIAGGGIFPAHGFLGFQGEIALWPIFGLFVVLLGFESILKLLRILVNQRQDRPCALGLLFYLGAIGIMAFGIGWGRSGFANDNMGLAPRYGWIVWPGLAAVYFLWLRYGGETLSRRVPIVLCLAVIAFLPFNIATGFADGENYRSETQRWEASVREGLSGEELIREYYPNYPFYLQERVRVAVRLMRLAQISYYRPVREPIAVPTSKPVKARPRPKRPSSTGRFPGGTAP